MRLHLAHHATDAPFVAELTRVMAPHHFEAWPTIDGSDAVVLVLSRTALREGLGAAPATAVAAELATLPMLLGDDLVPPRFPAHNKHMPVVRDGAGALRLLEDHRKHAGQKIADGKRELFGFGLLLSLLARA